MASFAQPQPPILHSWIAPGHYLNCHICREYRRMQSQNAEAVASKVGRLWAIGVGQPHSSRVLAISPRLRHPRIRSIARQQGLYGVSQTRHVTIQVPCLRNPVRPYQTIDNPEPTQYLVPDDLPTHAPDVPGQFPEDIDGLRNHQSNSQAATDFWTANTELTRQVALERARASTLAESSPASAVTENYSSMPGTWPSWADDPNGIPPPAPAPAPRRLRVEQENPVNFPGPARNGFFTYFGDLSSLFLGAFRAVRWRPVQAAEPAQQTQLAQQTPNVTVTTNATTTATQTAENDGSRTLKRVRSDTGPAYAGFRQFRPTRRSPNRSASLGPGRRTGSIYNRHAINNGPAPCRVMNGNQNDPNFNYAGHFTLDGMLSDSEDDEDDEDICPGSPMDIDSPEPIVSHTTEAILAQLSINTRHTQSNLKLDEHVPIALKMTEAISTQQPIHSINTEPKTKLNSATAAARRAVNLFPKDSPVPKASVTSFRKRNASLEIASSDNYLPVVPAVEKLRDKATVTLTSADIPMSRKTEKARYHNALDFFSNDVEHSLPGLGDERLPLDALKVEHLRRELMERIRREEIESQNATLTHLGVRRPKSTLIREPSLAWANRALNAPENGRFDPQAVHPDAVELKPRDFAKLVPPTAWLNDDCIQSTLCCLAAYINKKAGVKPKVDPPKCVTITSLYWKTFCQDHNKLYPRPFGRKWNMTPSNFLDIDTVLIPVNSNSHWTLIVIRPSRKTVSYMDSFHNHSEAQIRHAYRWLELFLGDKFVANDWDTQEFGAPRQTNAWDCGMFVITNAMCLALGLSPMCYHEDKMPVQRRRIAAMLLNGGFSGEFDLGDL
ncbi:hypothetical protein E0Z10_g6647 [Xylaria hypoxylon]|uniref:Ubiquitin-like protease family profile domain-containing protein n=1 Tax=Xylaria hypoxylon TaxID=37992 RepID=A0A4Z0YFP6_9PEZI|nr:hypothetical protein E0Z10_g6647 [Xylaria hypoxylon]